MSPLILEVAKALAFGTAGYGLKWALGRMSGRAHDVRAALGLLEQIARDAEAAMHSAMNGVPDIGKAATVMSDRNTLNGKLLRALKSQRSYSELQTTFSVFALSLRWADPFFGRVPTLADIEHMRQEERRLYQKIEQTARSGWFWKLFSHERGR